MDSLIKIREANHTDIREITVLFKETILYVNNNHYNKKQVKIWSSGADNLNKWKERLVQQYFIVAEIEGQVVGFASINNEGYLDVLYVHKDYQGQGIAKTLLKELEKQAEIQGNKEITSDVSITARPFFEKHGFIALKEQRKELQELEFINYLMLKKMSD